MQYYIVLCPYKVEGEPEVEIVGIRHSYEEAKALYDEKIKDLRTDAEEWELEVIVDDRYYFEAIGDNWHPSYYMKLYIEEV